MTNAKELGPEGTPPPTKKRISTRVLRAAFLCVLTVVCVCWGLSSLKYYTEDPVDRATDDTNDQLARFDRTGDARTLTSWLLAHDDGGVGMNTYTALVRWSFSHQREFIAFLHSLGKVEGERICRSYAFSLADNGLTKDFRKAYQGYDDPKLTVLKSYLYEAVPWPPEKASGGP